MEIRNAELELSVIKKIMEDSRRIGMDNGWHFVYWGALVTACLLTNYVLIVTGRATPQIVGMMWLILMSAGAIAGVVIDRRKRKSQRVNTIAGRIMSSLWFSSGISMFIFGFLGPVSGAYDSVFICPVISITLGLSYFTSGTIQRVRLLQYFAFGWWLGGIILFFIPGAHTLLVFALMMIFFQILPGIFIRKKFSNDLDTVI